MKKVKNRKIKLFICCIFLLILIALIIVGIYFNSLKTKPKEVFISTIDEIFENFIIQDNLNSFTGNINLKTNLYSNDENVKKTIDVINNTDANFKFGIDFNSNTINTVLSSNYDKNELLNISTCLEENSLYINSKDLYYKTIMIPIKKHSNYVSAVLNQNDIKIIFKNLNSAINSSLQDKYFVKKNTSINLNGEEIKVIKNILTLDNSNLNKIINDVKAYLNNNDEFLSSLSRILNQTKEETKNKIESINTDYIDEIITISLYTKDNHVIGFEITKPSNTGLSLSVLKADETNYNYEIKNKINSYKGNLAINKSDNNINLTISSNDNKINGTINIVINYDENKDIDEFVKNDIIEIESITDQERTDIFNNLQQKQSIRSLINDLWNLIEI